MRAKRVIRCFHFQTRQETRALVQAAQGHFVRPSGDAFNEAKIESRVVHPSVSVSPPHASPLRQRRSNYLLTCMCVHVLISIELDTRDRNTLATYDHALAISPLLLTYTSRLTEFHSARLTCVTLPNSESRAFQPDLSSRR